VSCDEIRRKLDAYIDGELDGDSERALRNHISECAACCDRIDERETLGRLVRLAPYYASPEGLRARVSARTNRSISMRRLLALAAAAVLVVSIGSGITLLRTPAMLGGATVNDVVDGHVRSLMADHLFDVRSTDEHTVKPWFVGKLDFSPPVVDLASAGFPLVGGRIDYVGGRPVAALVYQRHAHTINVFVYPSSDGATGNAAVQSVRGFHVHHWIGGGMSFWTVSDLNDAELTDFVRALQTAS
jgi:anti-sigma factor (TIGR02949 family)